MTLSDNIRVLVVDDHPVVQTGLTTMLHSEPGLEPIGEAKTGVEAIAQFRALRPDVTLMDLRMPELTGVEAITAILKDYPDARIIILTTYDGDEDIYRGLQTGAKGYLLKDADRSELLAAIRAVHAGQKYIPVIVGAKLVDRMSRPQLSDHENDVLKLLAKGKNTQAISLTLSVTEGTVKFHITNILQKLGVSDRTQAVVTAFQRGIANLNL
ncbi:response regulator transcription factor [Nostoc sp. ChiQUE01b]|uniref:response regulator transcription factor n=1 Tax=Nostoc sp. ChiQUE01b TaxID=3075376 RepID=UPI002AD39E1B|nr:response regulator transcription factor [Nostoc sp. ChiQUE01b]MDZ8259885.1 response regulator transcription factor [Nostoc sp. ChiQUE01b]